MRRFPRAAALTATLLVAMPAPIAAASDARAGLPPIHPRRDVAVTYQVLPGSSVDGVQGPRRVQMFWTRGGRLLRIDPMGMPGYVIVDFPRRQMSLVLTAAHAYVQMPLDPRRTPGVLTLPPGTSMTRAGEATIAGRRCTIWNIAAPQGSGTACLTVGGLMLRADGHGTAREAGHSFAGAGGLQAIAVEYGPQNPALFAIPPGYHPFGLPHIPGAAAEGSAGAPPPTRAP